MADGVCAQYLPDELMIRFPTTRQNEFRWDPILFLKVVDGASDSSLILTMAECMLKQDLSVYPNHVSVVRGCTSGTNEHVFSGLGLTWTFGTVVAEDQQKKTESASNCSQDTGRNKSGCVW